MATKAMRVKLDNIYAKRSKSSAFNWLKGENKSRWYALVALELTYDESGQKLTDDYCLVVCSQACKDKPFKAMVAFNADNYVIQESIDMAELKRVAATRLAAINAHSPQEFHERMKQQFEYDGRL